MNWVAEIRGAINSGSVWKDFAIILVFMVIAWNGGTYLYVLHHTNFERALAIFLLFVGVALYLQLLQNRAHRLRIDYLERELENHVNVKPKRAAFPRAVRKDVH